MTITNSLIRFSNGELADSDEVLSNSSFILDQIREINYNLTNDGTFSFTITPDNFTILSGSYDESGSTACISGNKAYLQDVYDTFDSSVDSTKWTEKTGTATEGSNYISAYTSSSGGTVGCGTVGVYSKGTSTAFDLSTENSAVKFMLYYNARVSGYHASADVKFSITDGTNTVDILTVSQSVGGTYSTKQSKSTDYWELVSDTTNQQIRIWKNGTELGGSPFDVSALSNYYIKLYAQQCRTDSSGDNSRTAEMRVYQFGKMQTSTQYSIAYPNQTDSGDVILVDSQWTKEPSSKSLQYSLDNGSSWSSDQTTNIIIGTGSFTQLQVRQQGTTPSSITTSSENVPESSNINYIFG